jgi:hypothetical protein
LLYAAYCKAGRGVMPTFVEPVRTCKSKGVASTTASVDDDPEASAKGGVLLRLS